MPDKPPTFRPPQQRSYEDRQRRYDAQRAAEREWRGWYKLAVWSHPVHGLRAVQLRRQPLCETCLAKQPSELTPAVIVHHSVPHRGDWSLFTDAGKLASACKACHDGELQRLEAASRSRPCG
jgi:5-methylcytosine-specific restriction protein A